MILSRLNRSLHLFYFIAYVGNENLVDTYIAIMRYIEIWIMDIYELNDFKPTWKSSNIYSLPKQVFFMFRFNIFHYSICEY